MALLNSIELPKETINSAESIRERIAAEFWGWFKKNQDVVIIERRILRLFKVDISVKELEGLWRLLFGPKPDDLTEF